MNLLRNVITGNVEKGRLKVWIVGNVITLLLLLMLLLLGEQFFGVSRSTIYSRNKNVYGKVYSRNNIVRISVGIAQRESANHGIFRAGMFTE